MVISYICTYIHRWMVRYANTNRPPYQIIDFVICRARNNNTNKWFINFYNFPQYVQQYNNIYLKTSGSTPDRAWTYWSQELNIFSPFPRSLPVHAVLPPPLSPTPNPTNQTLPVVVFLDRESYYDTVVIPRLFCFSICCSRSCWDLELGGRTGKAEQYPGYYNWFGHSRDLGTWLS